MKRKELITWKRIGGGVLSLNDGRNIPAKSVFKAAEQDIPAAFRDLVEQVEQPKPKPVKKVKPKSADLTTEQPKTIPESKTETKPKQKALELVGMGKGWWKVVEKDTGKPVHDQLLRKSKATTLKNKLEQNG